MAICLLGGFTTNFVWCVYLNLHNGTFRQYFSHRLIASGIAALILSTLVIGFGTYLKSLG